jgi:TolB protein
MIAKIALVSGLLLTSSVLAQGPTAARQPSDDRHMSNLTQLTFDGDNGEAYFSFDGGRLIYQSNRGGYPCDKIWTMMIDGSDKRMVSPDHGAHTCSFFYPGAQRILFASTSHLPGTCPPKPEWPSHIRYAWPLYPYDIVSANPDGSGLSVLTDNPKYDAEPIVSADGSWIVFGSQREGDFDIYRMDADGGNVKRLTDTLGYDGGPWISPDGSQIVWRAWHPSTDEDKAQWRENMAKDYMGDGRGRRQQAASDRQRGHQLGAVLAPGRQAYRVFQQHGRLARGPQDLRPQLRALPDQQ